jgi:hypothetical protein
MLSGEIHNLGGIIIGIEDEDSKSNNMIKRDMKA